MTPARPVAKSPAGGVAEAWRRLRARCAPRQALLAAIRFYKRRLSPHKGFSCAYRVHTGCASCSTLGHRAVARYGVVRGLGVLRLRLEQCRLERERHGRSPSPTFRPMRAQAGFVDCDLPCDGPCDGPCDASSCDVAPDDCCDGDGCDWLPSRRTRDPVRERGRRLPPDDIRPIDSPVIDDR